MAAAEVGRKLLSYALARPARESLFTVVSRDEKYKAKMLLDTIVQVGGVGGPRAERVYGCGRPVTGRQLWAARELVTPAWRSGAAGMLLVCFTEWFPPLRRSGWATLWRLRSSRRWCRRWDLGHLAWRSPACHWQRHGLSLHTGWARGVSRRRACWPRKMPLAQIPTLDAACGLAARLRAQLCHSDVIAHLDMHGSLAVQPWAACL